MEAMVIADSDLLVDLLRGSKGAVSLAKQMLRQGVEVLSTSISVFELWLGALKLGRKDETKKLLDEIDILPLDRAASLSSAEILHNLQKRGRAIDYRDLFIAGIARSRDISAIVSRDESFRRIDGLRIKTF